MIDVTLVFVIGGMGTMYGAILGPVCFLWAQNYLQSALKMSEVVIAGVPVLVHVLSPDRWLFWLGIGFIVCTYFFPTGIVGWLRKREAGSKR